MDPLAPLKAVDRFQRRHRFAAFPIAVVKKFGDDQAGNLSALMAYYAFFAIFPLLLVFVTILGFVLQDNPGAQQDLVDSTLAKIPIIGSQIQTGSLTGSTVALVVGAVGAVLSGLGVTLAAQTAFNRVHAVAHRDRPDFLMSRLRGLRMLAILGTLQVASTAISGVVVGGLGGSTVAIGAVVVNVVLNLVLFVAAFRLLTDKSVPRSQLWPGIISATILWTILQLVGSVYITHVVKDAGNVYGTFATVIGLLTWLFIGARIVIYSAELNSVISRRLWPRGLFDPPTEADRATLTALAQIEARSDQQHVSVSFDDPQDPADDRG
jgi:YihY family inner membrane protein